MSEVDFRKAYAAEVKASAESKARCNELIEWTEQQRQAALASHAGQLRNTLAFKADVDVLVKALKHSYARFERLAAEFDKSGDSVNFALCSRDASMAADVLSRVGGARHD
jgi:uncharacterized protein YdcH (DUF465 family)